MDGMALEAIGGKIQLRVRISEQPAHPCTQSSRTPGPHPYRKRAKRS
jgi:hypothetical protein